MDALFNGGNQASCSTTTSNSSAGLHKLVSHISERPGIIPPTAGLSANGNMQQRPRLQMAPGAQLPGDFASHEQVEMFSDIFAQEQQLKQRKQLEYLVNNAPPEPGHVQLPSGPVEWLSEFHSRSTAPGQSNSAPLSIQLHSRDPNLGFMPMMSPMFQRPMEMFNHGHHQFGSDISQDELRQFAQLEKAFDEFKMYESSMAPGNVQTVHDSEADAIADPPLDFGGEQWESNQMWADEFTSRLQNENRLPSGQYPFEPQNRFLSAASTALQTVLNQARDLQRNGNLNESILAYEAYLQLLQRSQSAVEQSQQILSTADAWAQLGKLQAENEKEVPAILALQECLRLDPRHRDGLLTLAVSYTNEGYDDEAYKLLYQWTCATHYPDMRPEENDLRPSFELYNIATDMMLSQVQKSAVVDPDTQIALGLLFYNAGQHEKAIDCFNAALAVRPDDYALWNRLGATLANSGQSEKAIDAYYRALEIKPAFVRARYNLGVSCMNIGCYKDAAEHFLGALMLSSGGVNENVRNVPENLWETLRRCFILMERGDLAEVAKGGVDLSLFRNDFEF